MLYFLNFLNFLKCVVFFVLFISIEVFVGHMILENHICMMKYVLPLSEHLCTVPRQCFYDMYDEQLTDLLNIPNDLLIKANGGFKNFFSYNHFLPDQQFDKISTTNVFYFLLTSILCVFAAIAFNAKKLVVFFWSKISTILFRIFLKFDNNDKK